MCSHEGTVWYVHYGPLSLDAEVRFVVDSYTFNEEAGDVMVCIDSDVTGGFQTDLVVSVTAIDGKAGEYVPTGQKMYIIRLSQQLLLKTQNLLSPALRWCFQIPQRKPHAALPSLSRVTQH